MHFLLLLSFFFTVCGALEGGPAATREEGHAHGSEGSTGHDDHGTSETWEWAGVFALDPEVGHTWVASKVNGSYAAEDMLMLIVPTSSADKAGINSIQTTAQALWQGNGSVVEVTVSSGTSIKPGVLYRLRFNENAFTSMFPVAFHGRADEDEQAHDHSDEHDDEHGAEHGDAHGDDEHDEHGDEHSGEHSDEHSDEHSADHSEEHSDDDHIENTTSTTARVARASGAQSNFVILTEHDPAEFDGSIHYLMNANGDEVEPAAVDPEPVFVRKSPIGEAIGASFCVALASFIGVILLVPGFEWLAGRFNVLHAVDAFASGALISLIVFIMVPESLALIPSEYPIETQTAAWFGTLLLIGFITPILLDWLTTLIFPNAGHSHMSGLAPQKKDPSDTENSVSVDMPSSDLVEREIAYPEYSNYDPTSPMEYIVPDSTPVLIPEDDHSRDSMTATSDFDMSAKKPKHSRNVFLSLFHCCPLTGVAWSIVIGDSLHNFTDGVLIGVAFKYCGSSMGWSIVGASVVHELASELSEFWLLINPLQGKLNWLQAVVLNFLTSLTVVLGCLIVSYVNVTAFTLGLLLAFGAGLLLCIGTVSIWSRLLEHKVTLTFFLLMAFSFTFGAVAIGLVLLSHIHCDAEGGSGGHAGHAH